MGSSEVDTRVGEEQVVTGIASVTCAVLDGADATLETPEDPRIPPGKLFFKIGEVAQILDIKPYVLRYWESEFPWIRPAKTSSKQRLYRRQDVALLLKIKRLRYADGQTIASAKEHIKQLRSSLPRGDSNERSRVRERSSAGARGQSVVNSPRALGLAGPVDAQELAGQLMNMRRTVLEIMEMLEDEN